MPTFAKASPAHSHSMPDRDKMPVARNARLTGMLAGEADGHWQVTGGSIDGRRLDDHIRLIFKDHWLKLPRLPSRREWISLVPTYAKSSTGHSKDLAGSEKCAVRQGAKLVADLVGEVGAYWRIAAAAVDGQAFPAGVDYILKDHWLLFPASADTAAAPPAAAGEAAVLTEARLTGARWSFGAAGCPPSTTSFYFQHDGTVGGYRHHNTKFWTLTDGRLRLMAADGRVTWEFGAPRIEDGRLCLAGVAGIAAHGRARAVLSEMPRVVGQGGTMRVAEAEGAAEGARDDTGVKLIIWDLDDTFWDGTLAEGGIRPIERNIALVREMSQRGIINSICSKNDFAKARAELVALDIWSFFVFPKIAFAPKGAMIQEIIAAAQLRPQSVLFIDDNVVNINEALHYNPGIQVGEPPAIDGLLVDPRCRGKPDPGLTRLARYHILEEKAADRSSKNTDNLDFLRQSEVRVSFHHDIDGAFARVHDLVNRTNQLNFTKHRWPEDEAAARACFAAELAQNYNSQCGYVKVADRYGNYGICGFFLVTPGGCRHFLFSCRTLNMGIEQFVWQRLGRPHLDIVGEVVAELGDLPDWIAVVDDAETGIKEAGGGARISVCLRGACDLATVSHYLRLRYDTAEEFTYVYQGWGIHPVARAVAVYDQVHSPAGQALMARLPGMPPRRFESAIHSRASDVYVISFSSEVFCGLFRSRSTGLILPFHNGAIGNVDLRRVSYDRIRQRQGAGGLTRSEWEFLKADFEFLGILDEDLLARDVADVFSKIQDKTVIVLMLSTEIGRDRFVLSQFRKINEIVRPLAHEFNFHTVELNELIRDETDLIGPGFGGAHFSRDIYRRIAERAADIIETVGLPVEPKGSVPA